MTIGILYIIAVVALLLHLRPRKITYVIIHSMDELLPPVDPRNFQ